MRRWLALWHCILALAVALSVAACTSTGTRPTTQRPTQTLAASASATPAATVPVEVAQEIPSPGAPRLWRVSNPFERRHLSPGESIAHAGLFFMQVATGALEAWLLPNEENAIYSTSPDNRWIIAYTPAAAYLADRQGDAAFRWDRNHLSLLAARGEHLLFFDQGRIWIAGPQRPEPILLPIPLALPGAVVSPDGQMAAVLCERTLYRVQFEDATCRALGEVTASAGTSLESLSLQAGRGGEEIVVNAYLAEGTGAERKTRQRLTRYSWQGERLGEVTLPTAQHIFSPDGRWAAWEETLAYAIRVVVVADAVTLAPRFRIASASLCFYDFGSGDWLADSSGVIVRTAAGYHIATLDGELVAVPTLAGAAGDAAGETDEPLPAPGRSDLFAIGRRAVVDASGQLLAVANLDRPGSPWAHPADLAPWGLDASELRFALPHLGHGGHCGDWEYNLPARVELPPFDQPVLAVGLSADACANLNAGPGLSAQVLACLPGGSRLSLAPSAETLTEASPEGEGVTYLSPSVAWADDHYWLRVRAPDGQEGWIDAQAGQVTWAP